jgi:hypothetical protein
LTKKKNFKKLYKFIKDFKRDDFKFYSIIKNEFKNKKEIEEINNFKFFMYILKKFVNKIKIIIKNI